jgi:FAD:protein FMN transferase
VSLPIPARRSVLIAGGLAAGAWLARGWMADGLSAFRRYGVALGTSVSIVVAHDKGGEAHAALDCAWREIASVDRHLSLFDATSALSKLNAEGRLDDPPAIVREAIDQALALASITDGAFDPTVQPLWTTYARAHRAGRLPREDEIEHARRLVDWRQVELAPQGIRFARPGMAITLNGIAQGIATERALRAIERAGIAHALVDAGEIGAAGHRHDGRAWTAGIADPRERDGLLATASPVDGILATSGDYETYWSPDLANHHIVDPRTGRSPPELASATVLSRSGAMADGLSTAMMVLGSERALALAARLPSTHVLLVTKTGRSLASAGFPLGPSA